MNSVAIACHEDMKVQGYSNYFCDPLRLGAWVAIKGGM